MFVQVCFTTKKNCSISNIFVLYKSNLTFSKYCFNLNKDFKLCNKILSIIKWNFTQPLKPFFLILTGGFFFI